MLTALGGGSGDATGLPLRDAVVLVVTYGLLVCAVAVVVGLRRRETRLTRV